MWPFIARKILRNRVALIVILTVSTLFMSYHAFKVELSYDTVKILPSNDSSYIAYNRFKELFGQDGNIMVIGIKDTNFFTLNKFNDCHNLSLNIKKISGIDNVISITNVSNIAFDDSLHKIMFVPFLPNMPESQEDLNKVKLSLDSLPFYNGFVINKETGAHLMAITFSQSDINTKHRIDIVNQVKDEALNYASKHNVDVHISGMPYIRTVFMQKVSKEMFLFLILALVLMFAILWFLFRSFSSVLLSLAIVIIGVIWSVGCIELFGYKISVLSALVPPLILIIGVPNCIFFINKYHAEYARHKNKTKAIARMINTMGITLFLANLTTAIGFAVLYFTNSAMLVEFGVVAGLNVMITFFISLIFIPIVLSYLKAPDIKHTQYLEGHRINKVLDWVTFLATQKRKQVYWVIALITVLSFIGMSKISVLGFVVDDFPKKDKVYDDLRFFESNFNGVLPFEILIDTKKPNGVFSDNARALYKINALQKKLARHPEFSKPLSMAEAIKFSYQCYKNGNPKFYILPGFTELKKLSDYSLPIKSNYSNFNLFLDKSRQYTRISYQIADVGSERIKTLMEEIKPQADSVFKDTDYELSFTGHSLIFLKGNDYLLSNLLESLGIEIILILLIGLALFQNLRIILLSKLPCLIPLVITAGIMGFLGVRFKPSTILIFSIAFGISSDGTIYFLSKFRQELQNKNQTYLGAIKATIIETGRSMIYTNVILFVGFFIFALSDFGSTATLGILLSVTLLVAMCTNLLLLPSIMLSIEGKIAKKLLKIK
ncbi:MAG: MMPL family transporter [Bacteroidia bacterium]|nr:MMPL family transporter [Bacteroidia bacterium]